MSRTLMEAYMRLRPAEQAAYREHQRRIQVPDKDKRRRAMREYRTWLDYLARIGRITEAQAAKLEYFRLPERYVKD